MKNNKLLIIFLILFIILSLGLGTYIVCDKLIFSKAYSDENVDSNTTETATDTQITSQVNLAALQNEIQTVYENAFKMINSHNSITDTEPTGLIDWRSVDIQIGQEGTIGGIRTVKAVKYDFSKIEPYFTQRAINVLKYYYSSTPYGHTDGNYYIILNEDNQDSKLSFLGTAFNSTDSGIEQFEIVSVDEDTILAVSKESNFMKLDQYLVFKKEDGKWKIDMFEYL